MSLNMGYLSFLWVPVIGRIARHTARDQIWPYLDILKFLEPKNLENFRSQSSCAKVKGRMRSKGQAHVRAYPLG